MRLNLTRTIGIIFQTTSAADYWNYRRSL